MIVAPAAVVTLYADRVEEYHRAARFMCEQAGVTYSVERERPVGTRGIFRKRFVVEMVVEIKGEEGVVEPLKRFLEALASDLCRL